MQFGTMQLKDLFKNLSHGELSNLSMSNEGNGTIKESFQPKIVLYANEALLRLYSRFVLRERDCLIRMYKHITNYHLLPRFAVNAGNVHNIETIRYILDLPKEPFEEEVLAILHVFDSDGCRLPLNDEHSPASVFTPQVNVLQVPMPEQGKVLAIGYQCKHSTLTGDVNQHLFVPETLQGAFTAYIAYKVYSHMNTQESTAKAQEHMAVYDGICTELEAKNTLSTSVSTSFNLFEARGFV